MIVIHWAVAANYDDDGDDDAAAAVAVAVAVAVAADDDDIQGDDESSPTINVVSIRWMDGRVVCSAQQHNTNWSSMFAARQ
ncbi:unnamed protein product [Enterobius vermicularis]|uniref:Secreted protein n=1 Tax=Enterobius vermicularis TaxID=51028 RepID=A0A0N4VNE2_ENTVE|nr:unnamed protein product [Enterobius vermicularis]